MDQFNLLFYLFKSVVNIQFPLWHLRRDHVVPTNVELVPADDGQVHGDVRLQRVAEDVVTNEAVGQEAGGPCA